MSETTTATDLSAFSTAQLREELRRRATKTTRDPAFRCDRCGGVGYFEGHWSPAAFARQSQWFDHQHRQCSPYYGGGGI